MIVLLLIQNDAAVMTTLAHEISERLANSK